MLYSKYSKFTLKVKFGVNLGHFLTKFTPFWLFSTLYSKSSGCHTPSGEGLGVGDDDRTAQRGFTVEPFSYFGFRRFWYSSSPIALWAFPVFQIFMGFGFIFINIPSWISKFGFSGAGFKHFFIFFLRANTNLAKIMPAAILFIPISVNIHGHFPPAIRTIFCFFSKNFSFFIFHKVTSISG